MEVHAARRLTYPVPSENSIRHRKRPGNAVLLGVVELLEVELGGSHLRRHAYAQRMLFENALS